MREGEEIELRVERRSARHAGGIGEMLFGSDQAPDAMKSDGRGIAIASSYFYVLHAMGKNDVNQFISGIVGFGGDAVQFREGFFLDAD